MMKQPSITVTLWRRPEYSLRVLQHLSKCIGIEKYVVSIFCEPGQPAVHDIATKTDIGCLDKEVIINSQQMGCTGNIMQAVQHGFNMTDYNIMVEDDVLLAPDALLWFEWAEQFLDDPEVFTVAAYHKELVLPDQYHTYRREKWFTPWGWATWEDRFDEIKTRIAGCMGDGQSWDNITNHLARKDRVQLTPDLSRSQNIGAEGGTYCPGPEWHRENQFNEFWAGKPGLVIDNDRFKTWKLRATQE